MSDVFISYSSSTTAKAQQMAEALRASGYSVWRDDQIPAHRSFASVIDERLESAKAVVVIWSQAAVNSDWVQSEADTARVERKLIQLTIDGSRLPRPFDRIQCTDLTDWDGDLDAPAWRKVVESVAQLTGMAPKLSPLNANGRGEAPASPAARSTVDAERKTVTVLFADIRDWLARQHELDLEESLAITEPALTVMTEAVQRHDGHVVQTTDDGLLAVFGAPLAREDHPQQALHAALDLRDDLGRHCSNIGPVREPLQARIGVSTGEVIVRTTRMPGGRETHIPSGPVASLAYRLQADAAAGSIVISAPTAKLVEGYFELRPLSLDAFEVAGLGAHQTRLEHSARRGYTPFVGRQRELEAVISAAVRTRAGRGQIVALVAEPGTGKSRLVHEFRAVHTEDWTVLEVSANARGQSSAYLPIIELLQGYFGIAPADDAPARREKIADRIVALDPALRDLPPYLNGLLGVPEQPDPLSGLSALERRRRTHDAVKRVLMRESLERPLAIIVEDLHWIDEASQEILNQLAGSVGAARVLLLLNYRPEYSDPWRGKSYHTSLRLDGLSGDSADAMISILVGDAPDLEPLRRLIVERTEGNPFFMEETVRTLFDEQVLVRNGSVKLTRPLVGLKIPATVHAILAARIDRLPGEQKALLQALAVIGRTFSLAVATAVTGIGEWDLTSMLATLEEEELIYEQPALGDVGYTFRHALTRDVAYGTLLNEQRRALHRRTALALETMLSGGSAEQPGDAASINTLLAHHLEEAGEPDRAADYLLLESGRVFALGLVDLSLKLGLRAARLTGVDLPADAQDYATAIGGELQQIATLLGQSRPRELANLPPLEDPVVERRMGLLLATAPIAFQGERVELFTLLACIALRLTLEHGQGQLAPDTFALYSIVHGAISRDREQAAAWSQLGLELQGDARGAGFARCAFMHVWFQNHWVAPLDQSIALAEAGAEAGLANDELLYGSFNLSAALVFEAAAGHPLPNVITSARARAERNGRRVINAYHHLVLELQFAKAMAGLTADIRRLGDSEVDEIAEIDSIADTGLSNQIGYYLLTKLKVHLQAGDWDDALEWAARAAPMMPYVGGQTAEFEIVQYGGLAALARAAFGDAGDKPAMIAQGRESILRLRTWSALNADLFRHKADLLEGVMLAAEGKCGEADRLLGDAAASSEAGGFLHDAGLAAEYLARVRRAAGDPGGASVAARQARTIYERWGAAAKVALVTREFALDD
jgi:predicted ATPase/class 3 adenylate cyclase